MTARQEPDTRSGPPRLSDDHTTNITDTRSGTPHLSDDDTTNVTDTYARDTPTQHLLPIPLQLMRKPVPQRVSKPEQEHNPPKGVRHATPIKRVHSTTLSIWWLEISAFCLAIAAFIAIVITLHVVDGRPLPRLPFALSVNTLIAIFVAIVQASATFIITEGISQSKWTWFLKPQKLHDFLTYDNASRGPWGALKLIVNLRCRPVIATLGAFIAIAAIILDPVSQQLIRLEDCFENLTGTTAAIPRTNYYDEEFRMMSAPESAVAVGIIGAAAVGQFSETQPQPLFTCQTGNCTFQNDYSSLGYCSSCHDVSNYLNISSRPAAQNACIVDLQLGPFPQVNQPGTLSYTSYVNSTFNYRYNVTLDGGIFVMPYFISNYDTALGATNMMWIDNAVKVALSTNCSVMPIVRAYQCEFHSCVHTFKANITNSVLKETTIARETVFGLPESLSNRSGNVADLQCAGSQAQEVLRQLGYTFDNSTRWLPYRIYRNPSVTEGPGQYYRPINMTTTAAGLANGLYTKDESGWTLSDKALQIVPARCIYYVSYQTPLAVEQSLETYWGGTVLRRGETTGYVAPPVAMSLFNTGRLAVGVDPLANIRALMQNMTDAMTTYMRLHGNVNGSEPAIGDTHHYAVCVQVRWEFASYIGSVICLLLIFFVAMVLHTGRLQTRRMGKSFGNQQGRYSSIKDDTSWFHDFKSNSLAVLFHGLDEETRNALAHVGAMNRVGEIQDESLKGSFTLVSTKQGWKLKRVDE